MLAAGLGARLEKGRDFPPKVLMRFAGRSLLERHIEILRYFGIRELVLGVGYRAELIEAEIERLGAADFVRTVFNARYEQGAMTTLWCLREEYRAGEPVLLMDGDVLYDHRLMGRLVHSRHENAFLMDRDFEPGEEPVKLCLRGGAIVDFHKRPTAPHDEAGEWIGFLRMAADVAARLPAAIEPYIRQDRTDTIYEQAIRDLVVSLPEGTFAVEDVTGLPWIEIDFQDDMRRARDDILPRLEELPDGVEGRVEQGRI